MTATERGNTLRDRAITMLYSAGRLDRSPSRWRVGYEAERDLRCARDDDGFYIYAPAVAGNPGLLGLPVDIEPDVTGIELVLDGGDRILSAPPAGSGVIEISPPSSRPRGKSATTAPRWRHQ